MDNCNCKESEVRLVGRLTLLFSAGVLLCVAAIALFFIGAYGPTRNPLWISTTVLGGLSLVLLAISAHSTQGWYRMFSVIFMEALVVLGTVMAVNVAL